MHRLRLIGLAVVFLATACSTAPPVSQEPAAAQAPTTAAAPGAAPSADEVIPLDPAVRHGVLDNGLTYYVRSNQRPENRAELRLAIDAGSILEDDDQLGLAHFVEHMAFNGTEKFEKQELIDYLESLGIRFGADLNAYTSFDETVYMLQVPTDDEEILDNGLDVLHEWAHAVTFDPEEVEKERGVVVEEWRLGRGASGRIRDEQLPVTFHDSRYAERATIGDREILESAPAAALERFYRDWYRPDLMAVVVVGDVDAAAMEAEIQRRFSDLSPPEEPRPRVEHPVPDHDDTLVSVVTDPEATRLTVTLGFKRPPEQVVTVPDLRRGLVDALYDQMMNQRLREITTRPDPPFQVAFTGSGWLGRTKSMYRMIAIVRDGGVERGLEALLTEAARIEQHGFAATELERAKAEVLRWAEQRFAEREKIESRSFAADYVNHFLEGDAEPGIEEMRELMKELIPGITLTEVNARAQQWITDKNRVILVSGPDTETAGIPDDAEVLASFERFRDVEPAPWVDRVRDEPLVAELPAPGEIVSSATLEELGVTVWTLSNGATVLLKPTDFKDDQVLFQAEGWGGYSLVPTESLFSGQNADSVVREMGFGAFSSTELDKALAGQVAGVSPWISELSQGLQGSASPQDLETMFKLTWLAVTAPRRDADAFQAYLDTTRGWLENREASPEYQLSKAFTETLTQDHPRRQRLTAERVDQIELEKALSIYRDRFGDVSGWTFALVGSFSVDEVRPLVEQWLASLPASGTVATWRDPGVEYPDGVARVEVEKGLEPKSRVQIYFHGEADWTPEKDYLAGAMARALSIRLREVLREDMGGVYGVGVSGSISRIPRERSGVFVGFGCDPERVGELKAAVFDEIRVFQQEGPPQEIVDKVIQANRRKLEVDRKENRWWLSNLMDLATRGAPLDELLTVEERIDLITVESLQQATRAWIDTDHYVEAVLYPEAGARAE